MFFDVEEPIEPGKIKVLMSAERAREYKAWVEQENRLFEATKLSGDEREELLEEFREKYKGNIIQEFVSTNPVMLKEFLRWADLEIDEFAEACGFEEELLLWKIEKGRSLSTRN